MSKRPLSAESGYCSSDENNNILPRVQGTRQQNLEDDGTRDWQEQARALLDIHYPDWKNPTSTIMVPAAFPSNKHDSGTSCEKDVYNLLQDFGETNKEPMFVVHSHKFKERIDSFTSDYSKVNKWLMGEHDFVIIHPLYGLIFLQVKARDEKNWLKAFKEAQQQIEKDKESINFFLKKQSHGVQGKRKRKLPIFNYPGFVVMPNCRRPRQTTVACDNAVFKEDCISVESFSSWWSENVVKDDKVDPEIYEELLVRFVALVHFEPPLSIQISHTYDRIVKLHTPEQLKILVKSPPHQWITGPAGSGKTVLLMKKVQDLAGEIENAGRKERILVLAFNKPLRDYLYKTLKNDKIDVLTYCQFLYQKEIVSQDHFSDENCLNYEEKCKEVESSFTKLSTNPPPVEQQYEHIFVDEGQDLYGEQWPELLQLFHNQPDHDADGVFYFWVMYDCNQHVQPAETKLPIRHFRNAFRLTRVLRNTENVFKQSKKYFTSVHQRNSEIELAHSEVGLNITWVNELQSDKSNGPSLLIDTIIPVLKQKVRRSEIVVLTRTKDESNELRDNLINRGLDCQNGEDKIQDEENDEVVVESVRRFKGLESKVVILYDPKYIVNQDGDNQACELMYVAVSRCLCYLIIISTKNGCKWLKSEPGILDLSCPQEDLSQSNRFEPISFSQLGANSNERHMHKYSDNPYEKNGSLYESGPPEHHFNQNEEDGGLAPETVQLSSMEEKQYLQQYRRCQQASQNESRPVVVEGSKIFEPGNKNIQDSVRQNVFKLLTKEVTDNLQIVTPEEKPTENLVSELLTKIEHDVYRKHKGECNSRKYTKELRQLKVEIVRSNKSKQMHQLVWETYGELKIRKMYDL